MRASCQGSVTHVETIGESAVSLRRVTLADVAKRAGVSPTDGLARAVRPRPRAAHLPGRRAARPASRRGAAVPAQHRLRRPAHRHDPNDRLRLGHRRHLAARRRHDQGSARGRARARRDAVHRRDRGRGRARAPACSQAMHDRQVDGIILASMFTSAVKRAQGHSGRPGRAAQRPAEAAVPAAVGPARRGRGRPARPPGAARRRPPRAAST